MKKYLTLFTVVTLFAFLSCEKSELNEINNERSPKEITEITECETAFGASDYCFSEDGFNRWGWVIGPLFESEQKTIHEIWAGAGRCMTENGALVGYLYVAYNDGVATITYDAEPGYIFTETHLYVGNDMYPLRRNGRPTVAPGQYPYSEPVNGRTQRYIVDDLRDEIYVIAHSVVCPSDKEEDDDNDNEPN